MEDEQRLPVASVFTESFIDVLLQWDYLLFLGALKARDKT